MDTYVSAAWPTYSYPLKADGFVVVSKVCGGYAYDTRNGLEDARDTFASIKAGEHPGFEAVGIFPVANGMPLGSALDIAAMDMVGPAPDWIEQGSFDTPENRHQWAQFLLNHPDCASGIAWQRGHDARRAGQTLAACPYIEGDEAEEWRRGWRNLTSKWAKYAPKAGAPIGSKAVLP